MSYLPINLDVRGRPCLVVGGGEVGERKVRSLLDCGAEVCLVSRELTQGLENLAESGAIRHVDREYRTEYLNGVALVFAATNDTELNGRVSREAQARGIWINVADQPEFCTFIVPASVRRGDLTITVSTGGRSPALAARIRASLEEEFGPAYGQFVRLMGLIRARVLANGRPAGENREYFRRLVDSDLLERLAGNDRAGVDRRLKEILGPAFSLAALGFDAPEEEAGS